MHQFPYRFHELLDASSPEGVKRCAADFLELAEESAMSLPRYCADIARDYPGELRALANGTRKTLTPRLWGELAPYLFVSAPSTQNTEGFHSTARRIFEAAPQISEALLRARVVNKRLPPLSQAAYGKLLTMTDQRKLFMMNNSQF